MTWRPLPDLRRSAIARFYKAIYRYWDETARTCDEPFSFLTLSREALALRSVLGDYMVRTFTHGSHSSTK